MINNSGRTPRDLAALNGHSSIVEKIDSKLQVAGTGSRPSNQSSCTGEGGEQQESTEPFVTLPLHEACRVGDFDQFLVLAEDPDCNIMAHDEEGNTPLHLAAQSGHFHVVEELANRCSTGAGKNSKGKTPVHCASENGHKEVVEYLAPRFPVALHEQDYGGDTPLHLAALWGHTDIFDLLCEKFHCDHRLKNSEGWTSFVSACAGGSMDLVEKLIVDYKCNPLGEEES